jgi:uncharacterized RmlC-like cupin family protein
LSRSAIRVPTKETEETTIRTHIHFALATLVAVVAAGGGAAAEESGKMTLVPSEAAAPWQAAPPSLPKGTQLAVLAGDPGKPGPFVLFVKFPPNTLVAPHRHATTENLTVLSGDFYHGMGEKVDKARGDGMKPGGFVYLPGGMPHYVWTTTTEAVVQVTGTGPFGLDYVHPEDDPSKTH